MITRRDALKLGAAGLVGISSTRAAIPSAAEQNDSGIWNWMGNPGRTGEMPGPGIDLNGPLGELWRIPEEDVSILAAFHEGILYTFIRPTAGWTSALVCVVAIDGEDGTELWRIDSPGKISWDSGESTPTAWNEQADFAGTIAISHGVAHIPLRNGRLWGLDTASGELLWDIPWASQQPPIFINNLAFWLDSDRVVAGHVGDPIEEVWSVPAPADQERYLSGNHDSIFLNSGFETRALNLRNGDEYWRIRTSYGAETIIHSQTDEPVARFRGNIWTYMAGLLEAFDPNGASLWQADEPVKDFYANWITGNTITRLSYYDGSVEHFWIENFDLATGSPSWLLEGTTELWQDTRQAASVCAGMIYASVQSGSEYALLAVDSTNATAHVFFGPELRISLVANGVLFAKDSMTGEIVAIGSVPSVLQTGGRARLVVDSTLGGGPNHTSVERGPLTEGAVVRVTGLEEAGWLPVTVEETELSGWLQTEMLEGLSGEIEFVQIDVREFGSFTDYRN